MFGRKVKYVHLIVVVVCGLVLGCGTVTVPSGGLTINQEPIADAGSDQTFEEPGISVRLSGLGSVDPDGESLTYFWQQTMGPTVELGDSNRSQPSFIPQEEGVYEFELTVRDGRGGSDRASVRIHVGEVQAEGYPIADAGQDQFVASGVSVVLRGENSQDPDGDALSYRWTQIMGESVSVSGLFTEIASFTAPQSDQPLQLVFKLTVTDTSNYTDSDEVVITVGADTVDDYCEYLDLYDNGICNADCPELDPDCEQSVPVGECELDWECSDGLFCNGEEKCIDGECVVGVTPCAEEVEICDEELDECKSYPDPECEENADCDDGLWCNGDEECVDGFCEAGLQPCSEGEDCNEDTDMCELSISLGDDITIDFVRVTAGQFEMGSQNGDSDELPTHVVELDYDLYIGKYEISNLQYRIISGNTPSAFPDCDHCPVEMVAKADAIRYCESLTERHGIIIRLPSEAEWEYACRAGTSTNYSFGDSNSALGDYAWYTENSGGVTHEIGQKLANAWGIYDMHGNVWEWCSDSWHDDYEGAPNDGTSWMSGGSSIYGVIRGGSWGYDGDFWRSAERYRNRADDVYNNVGFRVVMEVQQD